MLMPVENMYVEPQIILDPQSGQQILAFETQEDFDRYVENIQ